MSAFTSRKFLLALGASVFAILGAATGHLTFDQAADVVKNAVLAYIAAEGTADVVTRVTGKTEGGS